ncbi:hypothetical protein NMG60_11028614 [Bertholletia excelsa]
MEIVCTTVFVLSILLSSPSAPHSIGYTRTPTSLYTIISSRIAIYGRLRGTIRS